MLIKNHKSLEKGATIMLEKSVNGKKTTLGAFPENSTLTFTLKLPRRLGASGVVLRIRRDGEEGRDIPFVYLTLEGDSDCYKAEIKGEKGLFFYEILLVRGYDTLFLSSVNNHDFILTDKSEEEFHLLFYKKDFETPDWVKGSTMYHIFPDRFCRGKGEVKVHGVLNEDWDNGVPQFAEKIGDPLTNDVFFGGNLWGVIEKLDYLKGLGVNIIYLSPIFESASNHRYDTADYEKVDSLLGGNEAFDKLVDEAHKRDMKIVLDGVFNHTGDDSKYFNRRKNYDTLGAYQSTESPYAKWYNFTEFPDTYEAWWGIDIMPRLKHHNEECRRYFTGRGGIIEKWLERGADGWRLDVADELSDEFLSELTVSAKGVKDAFVVGEVWENGVTKTAYGTRREYFWGDQLDSVMNYPVKNAILALLRDKDTEFFYNTVTEIHSSYPKPVLDCLMNIISTHDTERMLTLLGDETAGEGKSNRELSALRLSPEKREEAKKLMKLASVIQYTIFGIPSLFYGDEAGIEGYHDPFCRLPYPWGREDKDLIKHYKMLGNLREKYDCLKNGDFEFIHCENGVVCYSRRGAKDTLRVYINTTDEKATVGKVEIEGKSYKFI